jgi:hypothetical protein
MHLRLLQVANLWINQAPSAMFLYRRAPTPRFRLTAGQPICSRLSQPRPVLRAIMVSPHMTRADFQPRRERLSTAHDALIQRPNGVVVS